MFFIITANEAKNTFSKDNLKQELKFIEKYIITAINENKLSCEIPRIFGNMTIDYLQVLGYKVRINCSCLGEITHISWEEDIEDVTHE